MFREIILPIFRNTSAPEDGQNNFPRHVELNGIINKPLLLHLVGCLYYLYQWCTVKQISDNEIYLLIKYIKSVLWWVAKRLSYIQDARCLKVNERNVKLTLKFGIRRALVGPLYIHVIYMKTKQSGKFYTRSYFTVAFRSIVSSASVCISQWTHAGVITKTNQDEIPHTCALSSRTVSDGRGAVSFGQTDGHARLTFAFSIWFQKILRNGTLY